MLAEKLHTVGHAYETAFNFGPKLESNRTVRELIEALLVHWPGRWNYLPESGDLHEASRLHLQIDKAYQEIGWTPRWSFATTVERTVAWYRSVNKGASPLECCLADIHAYQISIN